MINMRALFIIMALSAPAWAGQVPSNIKNGLRVWHFNEGTGTAVFDTAQLTNGTASGTAWLPSRMGYMLYFDGASAQVTAAAFNLATAWSICSWHKKPSNRTNTGNAEFQLAKDQTTTGSQRSFSYGTAGVSGSYYLFKIYVELWVGGGYNSVGGTKQFNSGRWYFQCATHTGSRASAYMNGELVDSIALGAVDNKTLTPYIGRREYGGAEDRFVGYLDELFVLDRALTAGEIKRLYSESLGRYAQ